MDRTSQANKDKKILLPGGTVIPAPAYGDSSTGGRAACPSAVPAFLIVALLFSSAAATACPSVAVSFDHRVGPAARPVFYSTPLPGRNGSDYPGRAVPPSAARTLPPSPAIQGPDILQRTGVSGRPSVMTSSHQSDELHSAGTSGVPAYFLPGAMRDDRARFCRHDECIYNFDLYCTATEERRSRCRESYGSTLDVEESDGEEEEAGHAD